MRGSARSTTRIGAYVASGALAVTGLALVPVAAQAAPSPDPVGVNEGATWLSRQLTNGIVRNDQYDFDDYGLSADIALALDAVGGRDAAARSVTDALEPGAKSNWYTSTFDGVTSTYAGSVGKALVLAQATGSDATSYGGKNLVTSLEGLTADAAPIAGRIENLNDSFSDANTIGQAFAARGLVRAGSPEGDAALAFLLKQQCSNGGFRLAFSTKVAAVQSCTNSADASTDTTSLALIQLKAILNPGAAATAAISKAQTWLIAQQKSDGSWGGDTSTEASNSNSTGLAAWALGQTPSSELAAQWLRGLQITARTATGKLAGERGAVAYDRTALDQARTEAITSRNADQFRRTTAQALPGLAYLPESVAPAKPVLTGPTSFVKAGSRTTLTATRVSAGDRLSLTGPGVSVQTTATGSSARFTFTLPRATRTRVYTVRDSYGQTDTHVLKVLDRANLRVQRSSYKVKRGRTVTATVRYLAPNEWARIVYKGKLVRSGHATSGGTFSASFKVGRAKGKKKVVGYGFFTDTRRGVTTIKVVR